MQFRQHRKKAAAVASAGAVLATPIVGQLVLIGAGLAATLFGLGWLVVGFQKRQRKKQRQKRAKTKPT